MLLIEYLHYLQNFRKILFLIKQIYNKLNINNDNCNMFKPKNYTGIKLFKHFN